MKRALRGVDAKGDSIALPLSPLFLFFLVFLGRCERNED